MMCGQNFDTRFQLVKDVSGACPNSCQGFTHLGQDFDDACTSLSQVRTDSTNSQSPGNILKDNTSGVGSAATNTRPKVFDENGADGGAFTGAFPSLPPSLTYK